MPLATVSQAIYDYLEPSASNITYLGVLYQSLPKVSDESELFSQSYPGLGLGCSMYMFCIDQVERRIALGGPPPPYGGGGHKFVEYTFAFLCVFKSDLPKTVDGQLAYNEFRDSFTARIRANRTAGTDNPIYGGNGSAVIFQWGEGGIDGGPDIRATHYVPRTVDGGATLWQSLYHINVCEDLVDT